MSLAVTVDLAGAAPEDALPAVGVPKDDLAASLEAAGVADAGSAAPSFDGSLGQRELVLDADRRPVLLVGLGERAALTAGAFRTAGAAVARAARKHEHVAVRLLDDTGEVPKRAAAQAAAEGALLGSYRFTAHRSSDDAAPALRRVTLVATGGKPVAAAVERAAVLAGAVALCRDLVNEPGGSLTPTVFAERAAEVAANAGLRCTVLDHDAILVAGMGGLLGVNRGSAQPPRFVELAWEPPGARGSVALVGKGITFDSGGLSLKSNDGMQTMKSDMAGAAAVLAALSVAPTVAPRLTVRGYLPLTDNMTGPDATRVGDVLTISNGRTVEVLNTDAEGRLVLADALVSAGRAEPDAIIDLATLTGAVEVALGNRTAGLFSNHDGLAAQVEAAADATDEALWRLPMPDHLRRPLDSNVADLRNVGVGR